MRRPSFFPVPELVLNIMLGKDRASMLTKGQKVYPKRALDMGFTYKFPSIGDACKEIVAKPTN